MNINLVLASVRGGAAGKGPSFSLDLFRPVAATLLVAPFYPGLL